MVEKHSRIPIFDVIKGLAILAIILIHVSYFYSDFKVYPENLALFNALNNISRFAIPVFFIASGMLLRPVKKPSEWKDFYWRKVVRIFIPYAFFSFIYWLLADRPPAGFFYDLVAGTALIPYYFITVLFQLYLLYPFLRKFKSDKWLLAFSIAVSLSAFTFGWYDWFGIRLCFQFLFFFVFGMVMRKHYLDFKPAKGELVLVAAAILFHLLSIKALPNIRFYNLQYVYGPAVFTLFFFIKDFLLGNKTVSSVLRFLGRQSLWIYLIHFDVVFVTFFRISQTALNIYWQLFLVFVISTAVSVFLGWFFSKAYERIIDFARKFDT